MNYLLTGAEEYLKQEFIDKLKNSIFGVGSQSTLDFELLGPGSEDLKNLADKLNTLPFSSKNRLVVIKNTEKISKKTKELILKYLDSPSKSTTLVLESSAKEADEFLKAAAGKTRAVRFEPLGSAELGRWIEGELAKLKKKVNPEAMGILKDLAGEGLVFLKNEIAKIASYAGEKGVIDSQDIEMISAGFSRHSVFELLDIVAEKRLDKALLCLDSLLLTNERPYGILASLAWQFRALSGIEKVPYRYAKKTAEQARRFTPEKIKKSLENILEADFLIKSGKLPVRDAMEGLFVKLCL